MRCQAPGCRDSALVARTPGAGCRRGPKSRRADTRGAGFAAGNPGRDPLRRRCCARSAPDLFAARPYEERGDSGQDSAPHARPLLIGSIWLTFQGSPIELWLCTRAVPRIGPIIRNATTPSRDGTEQLVSCPGRTHRHRRRPRRIGDRRLGCERRGETRPASRSSVDARSRIQRIGLACGTTVSRARHSRRAG